MLAAAGSTDFSFGTEFVKLFTEMGIIAAVLISAGLILLAFEIVQSNFGLFGALGVLVLVGGIVARMLGGGSLPMLFILVFLVVLLLFMFFLASVRATKYGWLTRTASLGSKAAVSEKGATEGFKDYYFLLNLEGTSMTDIRPKGQIVINEIEFDALCAEKAIERGAKIRVVEVEGSKIIVKQIK